MEYNNYLTKYGNFNYILKIFINDKLCNDEKTTIVNTIYNILNDKQMKKNVIGTNIKVEWRISDENDLLHYYTDGGFLNDEGIQHHTKLVMDDIRQTTGNDKFSFIIFKPLTKKFCML
jgi:hypothetical protein